jgi:folate-binding protein YgfZ
MSDFQKEYAARDGGIGFYEQKRGLLEVSGGEAIQFLNGLVTNDVGKMNSAVWMPAAFPNAQGRLLALTRVLRFRFFSPEKDFFKEDKFIFETEEATHEKLLQNLSRFTLAGDFHVRDLTENYTCISLLGNAFKEPPFPPKDKKPVTIARDIDEESSFYIHGWRGEGFDFFMPQEKKEDFINKWKKQGAVEISPETREVLRVENGMPKYGVDMDETTIVPELDLPDLISYNKGCYIGQEIIARIHFRGHVAKKLKGLLFRDFPEKDISAELINAELKSVDGKNAGKVTSAVYSPRMKSTIALGYIRYDYAESNVKLKSGDLNALVLDLPIVS